MAPANNNTEGKVEIIPVAKPAIMFVPAPVLDCCTIFKIGLLPKPGECSVTEGRPAPTTNPTKVPESTLLEEISSSPPPKKSILIVSGNIQVANGKHETATTPIEVQFPTFQAPIS